MHFPHYLPFHHFFTILYSIFRILISRAFHFALTQNYSLSFKILSFLPGFFSLCLTWGGNTRPQIRPLPLWKHQVLVSPPRWSCLVCSSDQTGLTTEPAPGLVSWTLATLDLRAVPVQLCSSFPDSHFSDTNSQGCFPVQLPARLPPFEAPPHYSYGHFSSTVHHSFYRSNKQTRVDCPAQSPPWGPSVWCKTVCSHPHFVCLTV